MKDKNGIEYEECIVGNIIGEHESEHEALRFLYNITSEEQKIIEGK